jgi:signal transduction histidine kinase
LTRISPNEEFIKVEHEKKATDGSGLSKSPTSTPCNFNQDASATFIESDGYRESRTSFLFRAIESLTHPFYVISASDYSILLANSASGIDTSQGRMKCYELTHNRDVPCNGKSHPCPLHEISKVKKPVVVEHVHFNKDGEERYLEIHAYPILDELGSVIQIIEYDLDVTEQRWAEVQLENETKRSKLYLDLLAHDMANQLQALSISIEMMYQRIEESNTKELLDIVQDIKDTIIRSSAIISKARGSEQIRWIPLVTRNLKSAIIEASEIVSELYDNYIIHLEFLVENAYVLADSFLEQLLVNIIENAIIHNTHKDKEVWIKLIQREDKFQVSIVDNGPGIAPDVIEMLFDPNHRVGGLGLHFSKEIVNKYSGLIRARSRVADDYREGTEFLIILPRIGCVLNEWS